jgi:hypothetical protein
MGVPPETKDAACEDALLCPLPSWSIVASDTEIIVRKEMSFVKGVFRDTM